MMSPRPLRLVALVTSSLLTACASRPPLVELPPPAGRLAGSLADGRTVELQFEQRDGGTLAHGRLGGEPVVFVQRPLHEVHGQLVVGGSGHLPARLRRTGAGAWQLLLPGQEASTLVAREADAGEPSPPGSELSGRWRVVSGPAALARLELVQQGSGVAGFALVLGQPAVLVARPAGSQRWLGELLFGDDSSLLVDLVLDEEGALILDGLGAPVEMVR